MKINVFINVTLLFFLSSIFNAAHANCNRNTIDEKLVTNQPENLTLTDVVKEFGNGCFGGRTAVTYQFKGKSGKDIWFWLKNEPEHAIQRAIKTKTPPNIGILIAVTVEGENMESTIIWPKSMIGQSSNQVLHKAYFKNKVSGQ